MNKKSIQKKKKTKIKRIFNKSSNNVSNLVKTEILGIGITTSNRSNILEYLIKFLEKSANTKGKMYIVTPNPEMIVLAYKNSNFKKALNDAQIAIADGIGLKIAAKIFGKNIKERISGISLMESVCSLVLEKPITIGFLGAENGVALGTAERLKFKYPNLKVVFAGKEWNKNELGSMNYELGSGNYELGSEKIENVNCIDILFVAFGAPKQEFFMQKKLAELPVKIMVGVGGAFDQIVNSSLRPPQFLDSIGLGWLYRLIRQPWRWRRQLALLEFMRLLVREKFSL